MVSDNRVMVPDVRVMVPDARAMVPDVRVMVPDVRVMVPDVRVMVPDARVMVPAVRVTWCTKGVYGDNVKCVVKVQLVFKLRHILSLWVNLLFCKFLVISLTCHS